MEEKINFEESIEKLEAEVKKLESGNMSLDDSLASFENAIKLVRACNEKLERAERRVRMLVNNADGTVTDVAFTDKE